MVDVQVLRAELRETVVEIEPLDTEEAAAQASVLAWIDSGAPLYRDHGPVPPRHVAVYFAVVDPIRRSVLQVDHLKAGAWIFPGGHVDTEPPAEAVRREASEELDIRAHFHPNFGDLPLLVTESLTRPPGEHVDVTFWFVLTGSTDMPMTSDSNEFRAVRWVSLDHVCDWVETCYAPEQVRRFTAKLARRLDPAAASV